METVEKLERDIKAAGGFAADVEADGLTYKLTAWVSPDRTYCLWSRPAIEGDEDEDLSRERVAELLAGSTPRVSRLWTADDPDEDEADDLDEPRTLN